MFPYPPQPSIDMARWPDGPWKQEPAAESWIDPRSNLNCAIIRHQAFGSLCGYVAVEPGHPLHGQHYNTLIKPPEGFEDEERVMGRDYGIIDLVLAATDDDRPPGWYPLTLVLPAHGSITFTGEDTDGFWWFGFDCGHAGDLMPGMLAQWTTSPEYRRWSLRRDAYRDFDYVKGITTRLAWALDALRATTDIRPERHTNC